ncbi:MAG: hypothetical protein JXR97_15055 [Planctomycetes bacterium]|nr:hypothetical protein [Planctomycetota bacterium]
MGHKLLGTGFALLCLACATWLGARLLSPEPVAKEDKTLTWGAYGREKPSTFDKPRCVAVAADGSVYCLDLTGRIQHFTSDGKYLDEMHMPDVSVGRPQGIALDQAGNLYVADTHYFQVVKFNPKGEIVLKFGEEGIEPGKLYWPCAITVARDGTIFTAEYGNRQDRIQKWSPEGKYISSWGTFGSKPGEFMRPMGLAIDSKGEIFVADASNHRVQVFTQDGKCLRSWGGGAGEVFNYPYDIAIDGNDKVYTVEYGGHRLQCFTTEGELLARWGGFGREKGMLNHPWGMDVAPDGTVFVSDTYNYRVVKTRLESEPGGATELASR